MIKRKYLVVIRNEDWECAYASWMLASNESDAVIAFAQRELGLSGSGLRQFLLDNRQENFCHAILYSRVNLGTEKKPGKIRRAWRSAHKNGDTLPEYLEKYRLEKPAEPTFSDRQKKRMLYYATIEQKKEERRGGVAYEK